MSSEMEKLRNGAKPEEDYEIEGKKQAAADVFFNYSTFVMACIGNQVQPSDLRMHLMKEISGMPSSLKESSKNAGTARVSRAVLA